MKLLTSKQTNTAFIYCPHPVTIDKSNDWGPNNLQSFPNGVCLKLDTYGEISHGVQPDIDRDNDPIGWRWNGEYLDKKQLIPLYNKQPIWADLDNIITRESIDNKRYVRLETLDGEIDYEIKEPSVLVAQNNNGSPDEKDRWIMTLAELKKNYNV